ncbi:Mov34/MPN/PAD-1 family protein [Paenibacillus sacheonensis]|uniref:JAB domain-containing protein n=1 Tax=Paenibacillus sacheonensis TaxID=742054 RepID=A0A7X5BV10_9BACL|nr:M67 family metallopeptidase [Paenibacillus sacheonensis]MBM7563706.1 proteasome lid subunit RPN8/RPN11 [Paenibacillus sacheonensis]NBC67938.1 hypothetical protein [Paenibacillus sacheonensis]
MTTTPIYAQLTPEAYELLAELCAGALPHEACGVLSGAYVDVNESGASLPTARFLRVTSVHAVRNAALRPEKQFSFDPADWIRAHYDMQKNRQTLVGFFHSHPASLPVPSIADQAGLPADGSGISYWIVSPQLDDGRRLLIQPYWLQGSRLSPLMLAQISV